MQAFVLDMLTRNPEYSRRFLVVADRSFRRRAFCRTRQILACKYMSRYIRQDSLSTEESPVYSPNQSTSSGSCGVVTTDPTTTRAARLSGYQKMLEGSDIHEQAGDEMAHNQNAGSGPSQYQQFEFYESAEKMMEGSVGTTDEPSASEDNEEREPGLLGSDGLLSVPHVKMVILLASVVSVRRKSSHPKSCEEKDDKQLGQRRRRLPKRERSNRFQTVKQKSSPPSRVLVHSKTPSQKMHQRLAVPVPPSSRPLHRFHGIYE